MAFPVADHLPTSPARTVLNTAYINRETANTAISTVQASTTAPEDSVPRPSLAPAVIKSKPLVLTANPHAGREEGR